MIVIIRINAPSTNHIRLNVAGGDMGVNGRKKSTVNAPSSGCKVSESESSEWLWATCVKEKSKRASGFGFGFGFD